MVRSNGVELAIKKIKGYSTAYHTFERKVMQFGNWVVADDNIEWKGDGANKFIIPLTDLNRTRKGETDNILFYEWILLATNEEWLSQNDLFDLNYCFVYAFAKTAFDFDYAIFDATLEEQYEQFDEEDNENFEL